MHCSDESIVKLRSASNAYVRIDELPVGALRLEDFFAGLKSKLRENIEVEEESEE